LGKNDIMGNAEHLTGLEKYKNTAYKSFKKVDAQ